MTNAFDTLQERGFVKQTTGEDEIRDLLGKKKITCYVGFDPTADSLHCGSLLPIMGLAHMQRAGHRTLAIVGGVTAMVGDPSGKDQSRQMMTEEIIARNMAGIGAQIQRFLTLDGEKGILLNNADWLRDYKLIDFLRDIGPHFSVNVMRAAKCFAMRMERDEGLTFLEFSYMLLQGFDFYQLYRTHDCVMQMGGDDQWSNILAGADLVRKKEGGQAWGLTFPLLTTSSGRKMGKTEQGSVWLDEKRTSVNDFYQYWRNTEDADVASFMKYFTFLDVADINTMASAEGTELNKAKSVLAYEVTSLVHGKEKALEALATEKKMFGIADADWDFVLNQIGVDQAAASQADATPSTPVPAATLTEGVLARVLIKDLGLVKSGGEAKRLVQQGGLYINREKNTDLNRTLTQDDVEDGKIELRLGKKTYHNLIVE